MEMILDKVMLNAALLPKPKSIFSRTMLKSLFLALVILCVATFIANRLQARVSKKITRCSFARQLLYVFLSLIIGVVVYGIAFYIFASFVEKASLRTVINASIIYSCLHALLFTIKDEAPSFLKLIDDDD